jgi:hypothetical protein
MTPSALAVWLKEPSAAASRAVRNSVLCMTIFPSILLLTYHCRVVERTTNNLVQLRSIHEIDVVENRTDELIKKCE